MKITKKIDDFRTLQSKSEITAYSVFSPLIVLAVLLVIWIFMFNRGIETVDVPMPVDGVSNIEHINFDETIAELSYDMDFYPMKLYSPEDFKEGDIIDAQKRYELPDFKAITYGTHRTVLQMPANSYFVFCGYSVDYSTLVYVNGQEVVSVGIVSSDPATSKPGVNYMEFPIYTGEDGVVELIMQYSNFVHKEGGSTPTLSISTPQNINRFILELGLQTYIVSGGLILLAVYYLLDSILRIKRPGLQLAFCCVLFALRDQWFYLISLIPYDYNWFIHYRVVVGVSALTPFAILTMIESVFPKVVKWYITLALTIITVLGIIALFVLPTTESVMVSTVVQVLAIPYLIYLFYGIIRHYIKIKHFGIKDVYITLGIGILVLTAIIEAWFVGKLPVVTRGGITPVGMLLFAISFMYVLAIQANEDNIALEKSRAEKDTLERINEMKTDFLQKMAHEIKTPLTVMSGYAQLTNYQITNNTADEETSENLKVISSEAKRLADLVSNLMEMPVKPQSKTSLEKTSLDDFLSYCSIVCRGLLSKKENALIIKGQSNINIMANFEMLSQMMINLAVNSNRHMQNGVFAIDINEEENINMVSIIVSDTGSGIPFELRSKIFEKGFSTNNTKGLGLYICKEIANIHNGDIVLLDNGKQDAIFKITIPIYRDEE